MRDNKGRFVKGSTPWHKGKKIDRKKHPNYGHLVPHSEETKKKMSNIKKGKHYSVATEFKEKTGKLSYPGLHSWINRKLGKATRCENGCIAKKYCWANKSGKYKKDASDWHQLCNRCNLSDGIKIPKRLNTTL